MQSVRKIIPMETPLFQRQNIIDYLLYGGMAAAGFLVGEVIFVQSDSFHAAWWLYMGNFFFLFFLFLYVRKLTRKPPQRFSAMTMLMSGHLATVAGIAVACVLSVLAMLMMRPDALDFAPAASGGKGRGVLFMVFLNATFVNFSVGSFMSIVSSYAIKWNQTRDKPAVLK